MLPPELEEELRQRQPDSDHGLDILCLLCRMPVTAEKFRISHAGARQHTFENPAGYSFEVGLFREARCFADGPASAEFTWFEGYLWQIALCAGCHYQLGWRYTGGDGEFFGLILDRLILPENRPG